MQTHIAGQSARINDGGMHLALNETSVSSPPRYREHHQSRKNVKARG